MSLEFEYLHRKSRCEMLIGGDDISNDVNTLGTCCHVFFNVCLHSRSFPLRADRRKSNSTVDRDSRYVVASSPSFSHPAARAPRGARSQARQTSLYWSNFSAGRNFVWYCRVNVTLVQLLQVYFECQ